MNIPNHVAIILDGNGRWAQSKGKPRSFGHKKGCENLEVVCDNAKEIGIKYLTVYAFSTENWKRSKDEIDTLMMLFRNYLKKCIKISRKNKMRVRVIGDITAFDQGIQDRIRELEEFSKDYDELHFQLALNYGSRDEITRGVRRIASACMAGELKVDEITEDCISDALDTGGLPAPDLMIRTSGEQRLSNFLLWQLAYSEFYFTDLAWPDFDKTALLQAIEEYNHRERRFGDAKEMECSKLG
ncbi:MAG: isoprenyl transferase [Lachnospiraceae bacterium]